MTSRIARATTLLVVVIVAATGLALVGGLSTGGYLPGFADDSPASGADEPTTAGGASDATTGSGAGDATGGATTTGDAPNGGDAETRTRGADSRYDFAIERVESCGTTCRNVTARLANDGSEPRENVRIATAIYADGDLLWTGNETVGRLAAGEAHASTRRVTLGFGEAMAIQGNDGYVTIVTLVRSSDGVVRFEDRRKVG